VIALFGISFISFSQKNKTTAPPPAPVNEEEQLFSKLL
jgi:hypothetical protein